MNARISGWKIARRCGVAGGKAERLKLASAHGWNFEEKFVTRVSQMQWLHA
jgi:hypothetical protein